jgi:hypothetical protein
MSETGDMARRLHGEAGGWDPCAQALDMIRRTCVKLDRDRIERGLPRLADDANMTPTMRANRIGFLLAGDFDPDVDVLATVGAQVVAFMMFLLRAEYGDPHSGGDDAA